jgi:hypothetical protein
MTAAAQTRGLTNNNFPQPLAPAIADKLYVAETTLRRLEEALPRAALETALEKPGAAAALTELRTRIKDARAQQEDLALALLLARKQDALADLAQWQRITRLQCRAVERHARARLEVMTSADTNSEGARRRFMTETAKMEAAIPIGCTLPRGALLLGSAAAMPGPDAVRWANGVALDSIRSQLHQLEQLRRAKIEAECT